MRIDGRNLGANNVDRIASPPVVSRFAPSPNGPLHLGHAYSALSAWEIARRYVGRCLLRIEDIDVARSRSEHVAGIFDDLRWLGLTWDEPVLRQSEHFAVYQAAAERLRQMQLLYRCFATRAEITAGAMTDICDPEGAPLYSRQHSQMSRAEQAARMERGELFAWRLDMARACDIARAKRDGQALTFTELHDDGRHEVVMARPELWGDAVIVRKELPTSYHLSVVVDDARQGVTHVTRGRDLYAATDLQRLLQVLLDLSEPIYCHHRLIVNDDGRKLAKSEGSRALADLRLQGETSADVVQRLGFNLSV